MKEQGIQDVGDIDRALKWGLYTESASAPDVAARRKNGVSSACALSSHIAYLSTQGRCSMSLLV